MHLSISPICQTYFQVHFKYRVFSLAFHVHDSHCSCESVSQIPGQSPRAHTRLANLVPTISSTFSPTAWQFDGKIQWQFGIFRRKIFWERKKYQFCNMLEIKVKRHLWIPKCVEKSSITCSHKNTNLDSLWHLIFKWCISKSFDWNTHSCRRRDLRTFSADFFRLVNRIRRLFHF